MTVVAQIAKQKKREARARREAEAEEIRKRMENLVRGRLRGLSGRGLLGHAGACLAVYASLSTHMQPAVVLCCVSDVEQKPLDDPVAERERRKRLVEEADHALTEDLFAEGTHACTRLHTRRVASTAAAGLPSVGRG